MRQTVVPVPMPDGSPRMVVMPNGTRIPQEGMPVEISRFIQRRINEGALKIVAAAAEKPSRKSDKEK